MDDLRTDRLSQIFSFLVIPDPAKNGIITRLPEKGVEDALRHDGLAARGAAGSESRDEARLARSRWVWEAGEERDDGTLTLRHLFFFTKC